MLELCGRVGKSSIVADLQQRIIFSYNVNFPGVDYIFETIAPGMGRELLPMIPQFCRNVVIYTNLDALMDQREINLLREEIMEMERIFQAENLIKPHFILCFNQNLEMRELKIYK